MYEKPFFGLDVDLVYKFGLWFGFYFVCMWQQLLYFQRDVLYPMKVIKTKHLFLALENTHKTRAICADLFVS